MEKGVRRVVERKTYTEETRNIKKGKRKEKGTTERRGEKKKEEKCKGEANKKRKRMEMKCGER